MQTILEDGFIIFDKDKGLTSFKAINMIKKQLNFKKIGHAGTLDNNATGLLIVAAGKSTKLLKFILNNSKTYIAEIKFGIQTNTDDTEGSIINRYNGIIDINKILEINSKFSGLIRQKPPNFSSVHINGKRAYKMALSNENIDMKERERNIYSNKFISYNDNLLTLEISCSTGTYIRSIARDLGLLTGYYAYLNNLRRTKIGEFTVDNSFTINDIINNNYKIISPYDILNNMKSVEIKEEYIDDIKNGKLIKNDYFKEKIDLQNGYYKLHNNKKIVAIIKYENNAFSYDLVF